MTISDFLRRVQAVEDHGAGKYYAKCPAHNDRTPSLSIREGDRAVLVKCWAGCSLDAIASRLGIEIRDLFFDSLPDPRQRREAMQRRAKEQGVQLATRQASGRRADARRHAEYLIESARGLDISRWSNNELNKRLNAPGDAYKILEAESHD
jgi:regulator of protease activity HflC (stomatin/prohibitin superfamily)